MNNHLQLNSDGKLKHFIEITGLPKNILVSILNQTKKFLSLNDKDRNSKAIPLLRGKTVVNLFFEPSTRTRMSFELAEKRLSADILNLDIATSSTTKGESLLDTLDNIIAMQIDMLVVRHNDSGVANLIAKHVPDNIRVLNAGDGNHAHPTQAMLDMFTIKHYKQDFKGLKIAIIGDIKHSRVARSQIAALKILGCEDIRVIAPKKLLPEDINSMKLDVYHHIEKGIKGVDVVSMLRLQKERMVTDDTPILDEYFEQYGLNTQRLELADSQAIVLHPGPINRGVEISSNVADGKQAKILQQVTFGVSVRMAILSMLAGGSNR